MNLSERFPWLHIGRSLVISEQEGLWMESVDISSLSELMDPEKNELDPNNPLVRDLYQWLSRVMLGYAAADVDWDPMKIAHIATGDTQKCILVCSNANNPQAEGILNYSVEQFEDEQVIKGMSIIIAPTLREKGLAAKMLEEAINAENASMLFAHTNSEIAALALSKTVRNLGFSTFLGDRLFLLIDDSHREEIFFLHQHFLEGQELMKSSSGLFYIHAPYPLFKGTDRVSRIPSDITPEEWIILRSVFTEVIELQGKEKDSLVQVPIVSIKK
jgi:hypothetical protein